MSDTHMAAVASPSHRTIGHLIMIAETWGQRPYMMEEGDQKGPSPRVENVVRELYESCERNMTLCDSYSGKSSTEYAHKHNSNQSLCLSIIGNHKRTSRGRAC